MKEITRIHIAKTAYDIELTAKKELEQYIAALEQYANDTSILEDIEIRITELLQENGTTKENVITMSDVAAVRERLGEPSDFAPEETAREVIEANHEGKRVYRDIDNALVGGVLAGIARYFGIDSLWTRLIFIVLLIPSFGTAVLIYAILWLIIPPAKTAAQKLQSRGKPVTLESIKALSANDKINDVARTTRSFLRYAVGVMLVLGGLGTLIATAFISVGIFGLGYEGSHFVETSDLKTWWFVIAIGLFTIAGALLAALQILLANAAFRKAWNKRTSVAVVSVIAAGLVTFAAGVGFAWYGSWQENVRVTESYKTSAVDLDDNFTKIKTLTVAADDEMAGIASIEYIVSDTPRYELSALPGTKPQFDISSDGESATLKLTRQIINRQNSRDYYTGSPTLKVYGPALDSINVKSGSTQYYSESSQDSLRATVVNEKFSLVGTYKNVHIDGKNAAEIQLDEATIQNLDIKMASSEVTAGVVRTLTVSQPEACPAGDEYSDQNSLTVRSVSTGKYIYNGSDRNNETIKSDCGSVVIDNHKNWED